MVLVTGHNVSVDSWAVGVLMCELLTGKTPLQGAAEVPRLTRLGRRVIYRAVDGEWREEGRGGG